VNEDRSLFATRRDGSRWWAELADGLLWPKLAAVITLALRPARVGIALVMLVAVGLLGRVPLVWLPAGDQGPLATFLARAEAAGAVLTQGLLNIDIPRFAAGAAALVLDAPVATARAYPWSLAAIALPLLLVVGVLGGALSRSAATEFARGERTPWTTALAFAISRALSFLGALATPILASLALGGVVAVAGWALLSLPWVQVAGALAYGVALLVMFIAVVLALGYALGFPLLVPALACEGTDAIDAIQRAYAYVLGRPLRLIAYSAVLLSLIVALVATTSLVLRATASATYAASTALTSTDVTTLVRDAAAQDRTDDARRATNSASRTSQGQTPPKRVDDLLYRAPSSTTPGATTTPAAAPDAKPSASARATSAIIEFWNSLLALLVGAVAISAFFSGSSLLYLLLREVNDGQDHTELWTPERTAGFGSRAGEVPAPPSRGGPAASEDLA
jgi:hypothetical protein